MVQTSETLKINTIFNKLTNNNIHALIMGESGTGKTLMAKYHCDNIVSNKVISLKINFSS